MLVTDIRGEMCWRQILDVGDKFGRFRHQHPISLIICVGQQHPEDVVNIEILSPTPENCHQHQLVAIIYVANSVYSKLKIKSVNQFILIFPSTVFDKMQNYFLQKSLSTT